MKTFQHTSFEYQIIKFKLQKVQWNWDFEEVIGVDELARWGGYLDFSNRFGEFLIVSEVAETRIYWEVNGDNIEFLIASIKRFSDN